MPKIGRVFWLTGDFRVVCADRGMLAAFAMLMSTTITTNAAGAPATGRRGAFGDAHDGVSPEAPALRARAQWEGKTCRVVTTRNDCAGFAIDGRDACGPHGWTRAQTRVPAENIASETCDRCGRHDRRVRA